MKKIIALMRKEYLETRHISVVILALGLCSPFMPTFLYVRPEEVPKLILGRFLFFALLNLAILCSITFVRERRNGTITALHRIVPDWRGAAIAKFGYAILSSLALALIFEAISCAIDMHKGFPFGWTAVKFAKELCESPASVSLDYFWLAYVACWGVFWTGRLNRMSLALTFSFFVPAAISLCVLWRRSLVLHDWESSTFICNVVASLIALALAPFPQRFGYRQH